MEIETAITQQLVDLCFLGAIEVIGCNEEGDLFFAPTELGLHYYHLLSVWASK